MAGGVGVKRFVVHDPRSGSSERFRVSRGETPRAIRDVIGDAFGGGAQQIGRVVIRDVRRRVVPIGYASIRDGESYSLSRRE
eukprot:gene4245-3315_t